MSERTSESTEVTFSETIDVSVETIKEPLTEFSSKSFDAVNCSSVKGVLFEGV